MQWPQKELKNVEMLRLKIFLEVDKISYWTLNSGFGKKFTLRLKIAWDDPNWLKLFKMYLGGQSTLFEDKKSKIISFWVIWGEFEISPRRKIDW